MKLINKNLIECDYLTYNPHALTKGQTIAVERNVYEIVEIFEYDDYFEIAVKLLYNTKRK